MKLIVDGNNLMCAVFFITKNIGDSERIIKTVKLFQNMINKLKRDFDTDKVYIAWDGRDGSLWRKEALNILSRHF